MGECHAAQADLFVAPFVDGVGEAVRAADDEDEALRPRSHLLLHPGGKLHAGPFAAVLVEERHVIACLQALLYHFALAFLLLVLAESLGVLEFRDDLYGEWNVVADAVNVFPYDGVEPLVCGLAHHDEHAFHSLPSSSGFLTNS